MLRKYGGYPGVKKTGKAIFEVIMKEVKENRRTLREGGSNVERSTQTAKAGK